jgi:hypothetical protein
MAFETVEDPRLFPAYSFADAARYLRIPEGTLRSWVIGRLYPVSGLPKQFRPLIRLRDSKQRFLSFINLVEAHVLAAIRRGHGLKLSSVRGALDYVERHFGDERPLISQSFRTDGLDLVHRALWRVNQHVERWTTCDERDHGRLPEANRVGHKWSSDQTLSLHSRKRC